MTNDQIIAAIEGAFVTAHAYSSKLPNAILTMEGMSGLKYRHFLNRLFELLGVHQVTNYLEIGSWKGSTLCSSIYGNNVNALAIDNFSEFGDVAFKDGPKPLAHTSREVFGDNFNKTAHWSPRSNLIANMMDADCFTVNPAQIPFKADVYFYDGEHSYASQYRAFTHFDTALANQCVIMVDDYEAVLPNPPREATQAAFKDLGYKVVKDWHNKEGDGGVADGRRYWWNGVYVALINKTR